MNKRPQNFTSVLLTLFASASLLAGYPVEKASALPSWLQGLTRGATWLDNAASQVRNLDKLSDTGQQALKVIDNLPKGYRPVAQNSRQAVLQARARSLRPLSRQQLEQVAAQAAIDEASAQRLQLSQNDINRIAQLAVISVIGYQSNQQ